MITDFKKFALECARAFGALVSLRDEPKAETPRDQLRGLIRYNSILERESQVERRPMPGWRTKVELRDVLEKWPEEPKDELKEMKAFLKKQWLPRLKDTELRGFASEFRKVRTIGEFNRVLDRVFDYGDQERIWIE